MFKVAKWFGVANSSL